MRAVLDTNILASGILGFRSLTSSPGAILRAWHAGWFELVVSDHIQREVVRTLTKPYFRQRLTPRQMTRALVLLHRRAILTPITVHVHGIATHPEDDLVLATAVSAQVDYLVTGDRQLQKLGTYQGVVIASPRAFLDLLAPSDE